MKKPMALDLFCGGGGATRGLQNAGFFVVGVDQKAQPRYCGDGFVCGDALMEHVDLSAFDLIWSSPPCQAHTSMKTMHNAKKHPDLIPATRRLLARSGVPWVIENVPGAPLYRPITLCGSMFGLMTTCGAELRRHRLFETSFPLLGPLCQHGFSGSVVGVYGGYVRNRTRTIGIYGEKTCDSRRKSDKGVDDFTIEDGRTAMGIDWMTLAELCEAIPPAYSEYIARAWLAQQRVAA